MPVIQDQEEYAEMQFQLKCREAAGGGPIAINSSGLVAGARMANATSSVTLLQEASSQVFFASIPGELLSVPSNTSQVGYGSVEQISPVICKCLWPMLSGASLEKK